MSSVYKATNLYILVTLLFIYQASIVSLQGNFLATIKIKLPQILFTCVFNPCTLCYLYNDVIGPRLAHCPDQPNQKSRKWEFSWVYVAV